jgi:hypothetical protein
MTSQMQAAFENPLDKQAITEYSCSTATQWTERTTILRLPFTGPDAEDDHMHYVEGSLASSSMRCNCSAT